MLPYAHFLGNETRVLYGKIQDWYARVISYEYMLMYITVVNMFQVVMNNSSKHVTEIFHDSTHALNVPFQIYAIYIIPSFYPSKLYIIYSPGYDIESKKFNNISGFNSFKYHSRYCTFLNNVLQTRYVLRIKYKLKPTRLWIILRNIWYQI